MTRRALAAFLTAILLSLGALPASAGAEVPLYKATSGPYATTVLDREWVDSARNRSVPARLFLPRATSGEKFPVVVFSHGLWANRRSYRYIAQHLASHGYVVILPQHGGSDSASLSCLTCDLALVADWLLDNPVSGGGISAGDHNLLQSAVEDPDNLVNRPLDISFAIDQLAGDPALAAVADPTRIGVAGHSFGAYTSMAVGGMLVDLPAEHGGLDRSFRDPRVKASLSMSAQGPGTVGISDGAWSQFGVPAMFLTGTRDYGADEAAARWRQRIRQHSRPGTIPGGPERRRPLGVLQQGGAHRSGGGIDRAVRGNRRPAQPDRSHPDRARSRALQRRRDQVDLHRLLRRVPEVRSGRKDLAHSVRRHRSSRGRCRV